MIIESAEEITEYLLRHRNLEECVLEDVRWLHFGTVIELVFEYVWSDEGAIRPEFAPEHTIALILRNVQEFHVRNALTEYMVLHPEELDWGLGEVSAVRLVDDSQILDTYQTLPVPLHHLRCEWEGHRQVDVVFSTMETR